MNSALSNGASPLPTSPGSNRSQKREHEQAGIPRAKKILVVDDNITFLRAMSMKLRSSGYEVLTAVDGAAAVSSVRKLKPDLILLDLNFPPDVAHGGGVSWDGLLILNWLRRMNEAQHIPVIAITAGELARQKDQCLAAGVVDVFVKPADHEALLKTIRIALNEKFPEQKCPDPKPAAPSLKRKKVLFVDDESDWRYMGTLYLAECGYEVFTAENAADALRQAGKVRPDVIVLDLNLGDDNGATLMQLLSIAHPHVPILIYTGRDLDDAAVSDLCEEGAYDCLRKGTMEELLDAVGAAIGAVPDQTHSSATEADEWSDGAAGSGIESVLIVEDDVEFGDMLRSFLESHPFCVTRVTDGAEGLRHIGSVDFDLIFCDMVVPHLSGEQLYQAVERTKPHLCNRFVFMTGHEADPASDAFIRRVKGLMLWKPFHLADLLTAAQIIRRRTLLKRAATAVTS